MKRALALSIVSLLAASTAVADANVTQKTKVQMGGILGGAMNVFGGRAAREGVTSDITVSKNRRISRVGDTAEIVDLGEEKIYQVDFARKTYQVTTFAELRKQFEDAMKEASEEKREERGKKDPDAPEIEVDFDVKKTGDRETVNGYDARRTIATVTVREKGKKLEESGGAVLTADMWMAPRVAALDEVTDFERRYLKKLWGDTGMDVRSMTALLAMAPQFSNAMKKLQEKQGSLEGSAVRTTLTFRTVPDPRQSASSEEESASAANAARAALGGLMKRARRQPAAEEGDAPAGNVLFTSTTELISASPKASSADLAIPAGFKQRK